MTSSPLRTLTGARSPLSSRLPSPTLRTLPRFGFSLAVSGRTMPLLVLLSASTRLTRILSPSGRNLAIVYAPSMEVLKIAVSQTAVKQVNRYAAFSALSLFPRPSTRVVALQHAGQRVEQDVEVDGL